MTGLPRCRTGRPGGTPPLGRGRWPGGTGGRAEGERPPAVDRRDDGRGRPGGPRAARGTAHRHGRGRGPGARCACPGRGATFAQDRNPARFTGCRGRPSNSVPSKPTPRPASRHGSRRGLKRAGEFDMVAAQRADTLNLIRCSVGHTVVGFDLERVVSVERGDHLACPAISPVRWAASRTGLVTMWCTRSRGGSARTRGTRATGGWFSSRRPARALRTGRRSGVAVGPGRAEMRVAPAAVGRSRGGGSHLGDRDARHRSPWCCSTRTASIRAHSSYPRARSDG